MCLLTQFPPRVGKHSLYVIFFGALLFPVAALSKNIDYIEHRLDRLERDIQYVQKNIYSTDKDGISVPMAGNASLAALSVQIEEIASDLRTLRGDIETLHHNQRTSSEAFKRYQQEVDLRLQQLELRPSSVADNPPMPPSVSGTALESVNAIDALSGDNVISYTDNPKDKKLAISVTEVNAEEPVNSKGVSEQSVTIDEVSLNQESDTAQSHFQRPREHYNYAFGLIDEKNYAEAIDSFSSFIAKYPDEELIGHAYYWLGESHYAKGNYLSAADVFRQGFEEKTTGPKAPDNLFKLAKSLAKLDKKKEACVVFEQLQKKYDDRDTPVKDKAEEERRALECDVL